MRVLLTAVMLLSFASSAQAESNWRALLSPGPIASGHTPIEGSCDECHLVFKGVPDEKCLKCHSGIGGLLELEQGFHYSVRKEACIKCHVDHRGRDKLQTRDEALVAFDHKKTRFPLLGAHATIECGFCHEGKRIRDVTPKCASCHEDAHKGALGDRCDRCHESVSFTGGVKTIKDHQVEMTGGHEGLDCKSCHAKGAHLKKEVACGDCHEQAHGGTRQPCDDCHSVQGFKPAKFDHDLCPCQFPGKHKTASCLSCHEGFKFTDTPTLCSKCHVKDRTHDPIGECSVCHSALTWKKNKFNHNGRRSKFKLTDLHLTVDCDRCHPRKGKRKRTQFRGVPKDCEGCHRDEGLAMHGDFGACARCHTTKGFDQPTFDHASTGFDLDGQHTDLGCQDCHESMVKGYPGTGKRTSLSRPGPRLASLGLEALAPLVASSVGISQVHRGSNQACKHCHESPHPDEGVDDCASCHITKDWSPSIFDAARHAKTRFALTGKHAAAECTQCHVGAQLKGLPIECAGCHIDKHRGKLPKDCAKCHNTDDFGKVDGFDHGLTGFKLHGAHAKAACESCHGGVVGKDGEPSPDLTASGKKTCDACHEPQHATLGAKCTDCHSSKSPSFAAARTAKLVDGHTDTGFGLERRHRMLACKECHVAAAMPPSSRCSTCHLDPHKGQLTKTCQNCHRPDRWRLPRFDHDQTAFPLTGRHFVTACADCHTNQRWVGLTSDCFDCHALDAARARAKVPGPHGFGRTSCRDCHFNGWSWRQ